MKSYYIKKILLKNVLLLCVLSLGEFSTGNLLIINAKAGKTDPGKTDPGKTDPEQTIADRNQEIKTLQAEVSKAVYESKDKEASETAATKQAKDAQAKADDAQKKDQELQKELDDEKQSASDEETKLSSTVKDTQAKADAAQKQVQQLQKALDDEKQSASDEATKLNATINTLQDNLTQKESDNADLTSHDEIQNLQDEMDQVDDDDNSKDAAVQAGESDTLTKIGLLTAELTEAKTEYTRLVQAAKRFEQERNKEESSATITSKAQLTQLNEAIKKSQAEQLTDMQEIASLKSKLKSCNDRINAMAKEGAQLEAKFNTEITSHSKKELEARKQCIQALNTNRETEIINLIKLDKLKSKLNSSMSTIENLLSNTKSLIETNGSKGVASSKAEINRLMEIERLKTKLDIAEKNNKILVDSSERLVKEKMTTDFAGNAAERKYLEEIDILKTELEQSNLEMKKVIENITQKGGSNQQKQLIAIDQLKTRLKELDAENESLKKNKDSENGGWTITPGAIPENVIQELEEKYDFDNKENLKGNDTLDQQQEQGQFNQQNNQPVTNPDGSTTYPGQGNDGNDQGQLNRQNNQPVTNPDGSTTYPGQGNNSNSQNQRQPNQQQKNQPITNPDGSMTYPGQGNSGNSQELSDQATTIEKAVEVVESTIMKMTNNDKDKTNAAMNLIGSGGEMPEILRAVMAVIQKQFNSDIYNKVLSEISNMGNQKTSFVKEAVTEAKGPDGEKYIEWVN